MYPDGTDILLLNRLQEDFPLVAEPWSEIASDIGIPVDELFRRILCLEGLGIIRGITPVLNSGKFGLNSGTLVAACIPEERQDEAARVINGYSEVSHNYIRDHHYSVWFTIKARTNERVEEILAEIMDKTGIDEVDILNLPTVCSYKTDVRFRCCEVNNLGHKMSVPDNEVKINGASE